MNDNKPASGHKRVVHKYSLLENRSELDQEKHKTLVQRKRTATESNLTAFQPSYLTPEMVLKPKTCSNINTNYYSNAPQLKSKICKGIFEIIILIHANYMLFDLF